MTTLAPPSLSAAIASSRPVPQAEIQHHDIGAQDARSIERLAYARGLADDVEALRCLQNAANATPDELVVVDRRTVTTATATIQHCGTSAMMARVRTDGTRDVPRHPGHDASDT